MANVEFGSCDGSDTTVSKITESTQDLLSMYSESEQSTITANFAVYVNKQYTDYVQLPGRLLAGTQEDDGFCLHLEGKLALAHQLDGHECVESIEVVSLLDDTALQSTEEAPDDVDIDLDATNWLERLHKEEIVEVDGKPCPKLCGLRRLAKPFIAAEDTCVNKIDMVRREVKRTLKRYELNADGKLVVVGAHEVVGTDHLPYASVTFTVQLEDGRIFADSADAYLGNCNDFGNYPTAVASARAEGRVLRKVLGIAEHVYEELSSKDAIEELTSAEDMPIAVEQKKAIETALTKLDGVSMREMLETVSLATNIDDLTSAEAVKAIRFLNDKKKQARKKK